MTADKERQDCALMHEKQGIQQTVEDRLGRWFGGLPLRQASKKINKPRGFMIS